MAELNKQVVLLGKGPNGRTLGELVNALQWHALKSNTVTDDVGLFKNSLQLVFA